MYMSLKGKNKYLFGHNNTIPMANLYKSCITLTTKLLNGFFFIKFDTLSGLSFFYDKS